jgi:hypothetical protein
VLKSRLRRTGSVTMHVPVPVEVMREKVCSTVMVARCKTSPALEMTRCLSLSVDGGLVPYSVRGASGSDSVIVLHGGAACPNGIVPLACRVAEVGPSHTMVCPFQPVG